MNNTYKIFYSVKLHFKSPVHIGRGNQDDYIGAAQIVRNGQGEFIIPGTSIAGIFSQCISKDKTNNSFDDAKNSWLNDLQPDTRASLLIFRSAVLRPIGKSINVQALRYRDKVRVCRRTKTAAEGAKFSQWEIWPEDTEILIEYDRMNCIGLKDNDEKTIFLDQYIENVLFRWQNEGLFIGGKRGTGNGFCEVKSILKLSVTNENYQDYIEKSYHELHTMTGWQNLQKQDNLMDLPKLYPARYKLTVSIDYQNPLLIKGGSSNISAINADTDASFIQRDGYPYIPGSSIRGAFSSFMDKYHRDKWRKVLAQPSDDHAAPKRAGAVIFTDLYLRHEFRSHKSLKQKVVKIERHAEDQFSRAIYCTGKFDEERIFDVVFQGEILVLAEIDIVKELFAFIKQATEYNLISLGSGACHPNIHLEELS